MFFTIIIFVNLITLITPIIDPRDIEKAEFSYTVLVRYFWDNKIEFDRTCGGTIIHEQWILTAAHCVVEEKGESPNKGQRRIHVTAGRKKIYGDENKGEEHGSAKVIIHPDYKDFRGIYVSDIALVKIITPFNLGKTITIAKLPKSYKEPSGWVKISGWGATAWDKKYNRPVTFANKLKAGDFSIYERNSCQYALNALAEQDNLVGYNLDQTFICTVPMFDDKGRSMCEGDAGGGLIRMSNNNEPIIVGVYSYTINPCGREGAPSMHTKVSLFVDWIKDTIRRN